MIYNQIEEKLLKDIVYFAQNAVLTPREYGLIKKGTSDGLLRSMQQININAVLNLNTRDKFDSWFDKSVQELHSQVFLLYRENLRVTQNNPYTYTARLLSKYIKFLTFYTQIYLLDIENYFYTQHPIISARFLESFSKLKISRVTQIKNKKDYYTIVKYYRSLIDQNELSDEAAPLLELDFAIEV